MTNVIQFKKKKESEWIVKIDLHEDLNKELIVSVEQSSNYSSREVFVALMTAVIEYGAQEGITQEEDYDLIY